MTGNGYLLKVGNKIFPNELLAVAGYSNTPNRRQDKDSYTDGRGGTHRKILPIKRTTVKFKTLDRLSYQQKLLVQSFFADRDYIQADVWNDETNTYQTMTCYAPDITYTIIDIDKNGNFIYGAIEFEFIDYGG